MEQKEQEKFLEATKKHQQEKVEELAYLALGLGLQHDIPVYDVPYYVLQRARQLVFEGVKKVNFKNKKLMKARKAFLKECLAQAALNMPEYEIKEETDETAARDNRCEPVAREIAKMLVDENLVFSDDNYFNVVLADEEAIPLKSALQSYSDSLDEKMMMVISNHWRRANKQLWGKEKEDVKFSELDEILKSI